MRAARLCGQRGALHTARPSTAGAATPDSSRVGQNGDLEAAYRFYTTGLKSARSPGLRATMLGNRSVLWAQMGHWEKALEDAEEGVRLRPNLSRSHECNGAALEVPWPACTLLTRARRQPGMPHNTPAHIRFDFLGYGVQGVGRLEEALASFSKALSLDPNNRALQEIVSDLRKTTTSSPPMGPEVVRPQKKAVTNVAWQCKRAVPARY